MTGKRVWGAGARWQSERIASQRVWKGWEEGVGAVPGGIRNVSCFGAVGEGWKRVLGKVWGTKLTRWSIDKANICLYY